jgi:hypothetical protein
MHRTSTLACVVKTKKCVYILRVGKSTLKGSEVEGFIIVVPADPCATGALLFPGVCVLTAVPITLAKRVCVYYCSTCYKAVRVGRGEGEKKGSARGSVHWAATMPQPSTLRLIRNAVALAAASPTLLFVTSATGRMPRA